MMEENIIPFNYNITRQERQILMGHKPIVLWFTGLSGSGKSTIANAVAFNLHKNGIKTYSLDGDNIRKGINSDLDFSEIGRQENIRRIAEIANLMVDSGLVVLAAFVSPYKNNRINVKNTIKGATFVEIYVNTSLEECEKRDVKGLYKKARKGEIKNMTGISSPYEAPDNPDVEIKTELESVDESVEKVLSYVLPKLEITNE